MHAVINSTRKPYDHVATQTLWSRALELRMVLQKGLTAANALPLPDDIAVLRAAPGPAATLRSLTDAMHGTLRDMLTLHDTLVQQHAAIGTAAESAGAPSALAPLEDGAASLDAAWTALVQRDAMVAPFRDASVDRWHRKVLLGSSGSMRGGLQALNQSVSQQVVSLVFYTTQGFIAVVFTLRLINCTGCDAYAGPRPPCAAYAPASVGGQACELARGGRSRGHG